MKTLLIFFILALSILLIMNSQGVSNRVRTGFSSREVRLVLLVSILAFLVIFFPTLKEQLKSFRRKLNDFS